LVNIAYGAASRWHGSVPKYLLNLIKEYVFTLFLIIQYPVTYPMAYEE
jgi:hypothetical protein